MQLAQLPAAVRTSIEFYARAAYPNECCGVLLGQHNAQGKLHLTEALEVPNSAPDKAHRFLLDAAAYAAVEQRIAARNDPALQLAGYFHSHPDAPPVPSETDLEDALGLYAFARTEYVYAIQQCNSNAMPELRFWKLDFAQKKFVELLAG